MSIIGFEWATINYSGISSNILINHDKYDVYIFGAGASGAQALEYLTNSNIAVRGFIDNNSDKVGSLLNNYQVFSLKEVKKECTHIYIASTWYYDIKVQLQNEGYRHSILPIEFLTWDNYETMKIILEKDNEEKLNYIFNRLEDDESKGILRNMINYRLTLDYKTIKQSSYEQYNHPKINRQHIRNIIDGGAYDGDTARFFDNIYKSVNIYSFEPTVSNYEKLTQLKLRNNEIEPIKKGLWEKEKTVKFKENFGSGGNNSIQSNGTNEIEVTSIDTFISEYNIKVDFIKMDIEGAEIPALKGAEFCIKNNHPTLAICVYHKPTDLYNILKILESWEVAYEYYLGHHSKWMLETVLYAIPKI